MKNKKSISRLVERAIILGIVISIIIFVAVYVIYQESISSTEFTVKAKVPSYVLREILGPGAGPPPGYTYHPTCSVSDYTLQFTSGWNYFSFPVDMRGQLQARDFCTGADSKTETVFAVVQGSSPTTYNVYDCVGTGTNFAMTSGEGYIIYSSGSFSRLLSGNPLYFPVQKDLKTGWNFIGLMASCELDFDETFAYVLPVGSWLEVWETGSDGGTIAINTPTSKEFNKFKPGLVYWIYMTSDETWEYDASSYVISNGGGGDGGGGGGDPPVGGGTIG